MSLFKQIGTLNRTIEEFPHIIVSELYYSELMELYIEVITDKDFIFSKPIELINDIGEDECNMIRRQCNLAPNKAMTYLELYKAGYVNLVYKEGEYDKFKL